MAATDDANAALDATLAAFVRPRTLVHLDPTDAPLEPTASRFGGQPYAEAGETWPMCICGLPLTFICQLDLRQTVVQERGIALFAFYYCWDCFPQDGIEGAWRLRTWADPRDDKSVAMKVPEQTRPTARCAVRFEEARSLPVWDGLRSYPPEWRSLARVANPESPWEAYQAACERVAGTQDIKTAVGGYPHWLQGDELPAGHRLLAVIDTEGDAHITWGDTGCVFIFLSPDEPPIPTLVLQSL
jgi:uncharacterized protein YwqG